MAAIASLPLPLPLPSSLPKTFALNSRTSTSRTFSCKSSPSSSSSITDFDLYDLLGLDSSCDQSQIKTAYRMLQKRCHPDIAGPPGHDMAIILNQAYSVLSDPNSRFVYDKEHTQIVDFKGYTGKPIYSSWFGSESEERAVFVDELKCVGCLKCALVAENTFGIESAYGRARVVGQWADPEHKIQESIEACPVDCISMVERSDLAALEFLMSKQPRGNVRVGASNTAGARVSNIFVDVKKFKTRFTDATRKDDTQNLKETDYECEARISAIMAIRSLSKWWRGQSPASPTQLSLIHITRKSPQPDINKLRNAAAARKQAKQRTPGPTRKTSTSPHREEYWLPSTQALPPSDPLPLPLPLRVSVPMSSSPRKGTAQDLRAKQSWHPILLGIPIATSTVAVVLAQLRVRDDFGSEVSEHVGGSLALSIVNSPWLQVMLAGITWYFIGMAFAGLVKAISDNR